MMGIEDTLGSGGGARVHESVVRPAEETVDTSGPNGTIAGAELDLLLKNLDQVVLQALLAGLLRDVEKVFESLTDSYANGMDAALEEIKSMFEALHSKE